MSEKTSGKRERPLVVYTVTITLILTTLAPLFVVLIGVSAIIGSRYSVVGLVCGVPFAVSGIGATLLFLWMAWAFFNLKLYAYDFVYRGCRSAPQFWLATGFYKWLEDEKVRNAFGLPKVTILIDKAR